MVKQVSGSARPAERRLYRPTACPHTVYCDVLCVPLPSCATPSTAFAPDLEGSLRVATMHTPPNSCPCPPVSPHTTCCSPSSCPAKAGHPVNIDRAVITGSPAFAGDDYRWLGVRPAPPLNSNSSCSPGSSRWRTCRSSASSCAPPSAHSAAAESTRQTRSRTCWSRASRRRACCSRRH